MATRKPKPARVQLAAHLRTVGLRLPGAHLKSPWPGHLDLAVADETFAYLSLDGEPFGISCKLPLSCSIALSLRGAKPTPYGLGKSGWVSLSEADGGEIPPRELLEAWLLESYRAQAPKKLLRLLDGGAAAPVAKSPKQRAARSRRA